MNNNEVTERLIVVLSELLKIQIIKANQSGRRPSGTYGMLQFTNCGNLHDHEVRVDYAGSLDNVKATPRVELEWTFMLFVFGENGGDVLRRLQSAIKIENSVLRQLRPLTIHSMSIINDIPELIGQSWEHRFQTNLTVHGIATESFNIDVIVEPRIDFERNK